MISKGFTPSLLIIILSLHSQAAGAIQTVDRLKAAYIFNIAKFTRWPELSQEKFNLCLYGQSSAFSELEKLTGKQLHKRDIQILKPKSEADFKYCHLLFVGASERRRFRYLLALVDKQAVLTIGDDNQFIRSGGLINLSQKSNKLIFQVNMHELKGSQLKLSSKMLKLAHRVKPGVSK